MGGRNFEVADRRGAAIEKAVLTASAIALFVVGYFWVGHSTDPSRARELMTPLDAQIPFLPATVWIYLWVFPASVIPVFLVRCRYLFRRTILAYVIVMTVSYVCFVAFPVTSLHLRVSTYDLDVTRLSEWAVALLYVLDPPYNLFPSLHLSIAALATISVWKADWRYGLVTGIGVALVGVSITTVKQHFVLDGIGGVALAAIVQAFTLRPYRPPPGTDPASSWRAVTLYVVLLALTYVGFYLAFRFAS